MIAPETLNEYLTSARAVQQAHGLDALAALLFLVISAAEEEGDALSIGALAQRSGIPQQTASRRVAELAAAGLVTIQRGPGRACRLRSASRLSYASCAPRLPGEIVAPAREAVPN